jgi:class 3 adenylate cyclase
MGVRAVAFTDIVGSTSLLERLGDERWSSLLAEHDSVVTARVEAWGGRVVKSQGDGLLLTFPSSRAALSAAVGVQAALRPWSHPCVGVAVRIGVHAGPVLERDGDVLGLTVHLASRVTRLAHGGEVLASEAVRALVRRDAALPFGPARTVRVRGSSRFLSVAPLDWAAADAGDDDAEPVTLPSAWRTWRLAPVP